VTTHIITRWILWACSTAPRDRPCYSPTPGEQHGERMLKKSVLTERREQRIIAHMIVHVNDHVGRSTIG